MYVLLRAIINVVQHAMLLCLCTNLVNYALFIMSFLLDRQAIRERLSHDIMNKLKCSNRAVMKIFSIRVRQWTIRAGFPFARLFPETAEQMEYSILILHLRTEIGQAA